MLANPGKIHYTQPGSYCPIALLNTITKLYKKKLSRYISDITEKCQVLHQGRFRARPKRSSQEALVQLVTWIKAQWRAGCVVGAILADVNSAFCSVPHPRMLQTLETQGYHPQLLNIIHSFLTGREIFLSFNGFNSETFNLDHGFSQGSPLSPLLYLLYNNTLLDILDAIPN